MPQIDPNTETSVANEALSELLVPGIVNLDTETSQKATVVRRHFAPVRDYLQSKYPWNFCERYMLLQALPDVTPAFRYEFAYAFPTNPYCLTARNYWDDCTCRWTNKSWKVQGRQILAHTGPTLKLCFTARVCEVPLWNRAFKNAFKLGLAAACVELCKDESIAESIAQKAQAALDDAYPVDAGEGTEDDPPEPNIIMARF